MQYSELSINEFLEDLSSAEAVPGGGGAAALAGGLAAALSCMVVNLTLGKAKFAEHAEELAQLLQRSENLRQQLLETVEKDAEVFRSFMNCYKLPKSTPEEKSARTEAIGAAAKNAASVPLTIAEMGLKVLKIADRLTVIGNPAVITDVACSVLLARAALQCAAYNVMINLKFTGDAAYNAKVQLRLQQLEQEALLLEDRALERSESLLN